MRALSPFRYLSIGFATVMNVKDLSSKNLVVVFGRPGSGKTTVANKALEMADGTVIGLDLDVCVPQWMKVNFSRGIYPSLAERKEFAEQACDYVETQLAQENLATMCSVVSFSFVNKDLRDIFRTRFPSAVWVLVDTSEKEAQRRIEQRENHFYKGKVDTQAQNEVTTQHDNPDWNFASVDFPHTILAGEASVEENAQEIVQLCKSLIQGVA